MEEACNTVVVQVQKRFCKGNHLIALQVVDCTLFSKCVTTFSSAKVQCALKIWPTVNKVKLETELKSVYSHSELHMGSTLCLLKLTHKNNLQDVFSVTVSLLKTIIATPMTPAESENATPRDNRG